jgi:hypothetical protein
VPGYSGKPLIDKLGIKAGNRVLLVNAPRGYRAALGPALRRAVVRARGEGPFDFVQVFARSIGELQARLRIAKEALERNGMLWVSWPKRASGIATDLDENAIRAMGLSLDLVDVKVCAVDEVWSGLKFVIPLKFR